MLRDELEAQGLKVNQIHLKRTDLNPAYDLVTLWILRCLVRSIKPDFVLGYIIKPVIYVSLAAWFGGVPNRFSLIMGLGFTFQYDFGERRWLNYLLRAMYLIMLAKVNKTLFQNPGDQSKFQRLKLV